MNYRIKSEDCAALTSKRIIEEVVYRIAKDAPEYSNDFKMSAFLSSLPHPLRGVFSAWMALGCSAVGGTLHVFESCCPSMVYAAINGFEVLGETQGADCLRSVTLTFPDGQMPNDFDELVLGLITAGVDVENLPRLNEKKHLDDYFSDSEIFEKLKPYFVI